MTSPDPWADTPDHAETFFYAVAYRWGDTNGHQYVCGIGTDRESVVAQAEHENNWRGGKYGIAVYEIKVWKNRDEDLDDSGGDEGYPAWNPTWDIRMEQVAYFPALMGGEEGPAFNERIYAAESVGFSVMEAAETGKAWIPAKTVAPDAAGRLHRVDVELPVWLQTLCRRKESEAKLASSWTMGSTAEDPFADLRAALNALASAESEPDWDLEGPALIAVEQARAEVVRQAALLVNKHP